MRIAILAIPGVQMLDLAGPMDVFSEANNLLRDPAAYAMTIVSLSSEPVTALNGTRFNPDATIESSLKGFDTLLIAGSPGIRKYEDHPGLLQWIQRESRHVRRVGSICSGAFLLAHAGLLNGRRATTHWNSTGRLAKMFPAIKVEPNTIYVQDGPVYTSAGVTGPIRDIHEWILNHLEKDLSVDKLAARLGMSSRNFARLFKRETDMTPGDYVEAARVEAARRILEESDTPLKKVARLCGFADQGGLRRAFLRRIKVTPVEYRQRFRPAVTAVAPVRRAAVKHNAGQLRSHRGQE